MPVSELIRMLVLLFFGQGNFQTSFCSRLLWLLQVTFVHVFYFSFLSLFQAALNATRHLRFISWDTATAPPLLRLCFRADWERKKSTLTTRNRTRWDTEAGRGVVLTDFWLLCLLRMIFSWHPGQRSGFSPVLPSTFYRILAAVVSGWAAVS